MATLEELRRMTAAQPDPNEPKVPDASEMLSASPGVRALAERYGIDTGSARYKQAEDLMRLSQSADAKGASASGGVSQSELDRLKWQSTIVNIGNILGAGFHNKFAGQYVGAQDPYGPLYQQAARANMAAKAKSGGSSATDRAERALIDLFSGDALSREKLAAQRAQEDANQAAFAKSLESILGKKPDPSASGHPTGGEGPVNLSNPQPPAPMGMVTQDNVDGLATDLNGLMASGQPIPAPVPMDKMQADLGMDALISGNIPGVIEGGRPVVPAAPRAQAAPAPMNLPDPATATPNDMRRVFEAMNPLALQRAMTAARGDLSKAYGLIVDAMKDARTELREADKLGLDRRRFDLERQKFDADRTMDERKFDLDRRRFERETAIDPVEMEARKAEARATGKARGDKVAADAARDDAAEKIRGAYERLTTVPEEYNSRPGFGFGASAFERAVGSVDASDSYLAMPWRAFRSLQSGLLDPEGGGVNAARESIAQRAGTLSQLMKPLIRGKGEGTWTDEDQKRLDGLLGDLTKADDLGGWQRKMAEIEDMLTIAFGIEGARRREPGNRPPVGHVEDGYRFKGGNPASPSNWEKVQ